MFLGDVSGFSCSRLPLRVLIAALVPSFVVGFVFLPPSLLCVDGLTNAQDSVLTPR